MIFYTSLQNWMASTKVTLRRAIKKNAEERKLIAVKLTSEIVANKRKALKILGKQMHHDSCLQKKLFLDVIQAVVR